MEPIQNEKGEWVIPASRRPDGTWRKERVVKEGYVPQDEVRAFETRGNRQKPKGIPGLPPAEPKKSSETKKQAAAGASRVEASSEGPALGSRSDSAREDKAAAGEGKKSEAPQGEVCTEKRIKALKKKIKDIAELELKDKPQLTSEQIQKLDRKASLEEELRSLQIS